MRWFPYAVYWTIFAVGLVSWWFWPQDYGFAVTITLTLITGVFSMIAAVALLSWKLGIASLALLLSPWVVLLL
ncbi:hypothetical protein [Salibacterium halotolerans]|uniref:Uncharacterized protein n=1 Tax=Salibacterium halotolerans TaxID=1884432 RepID=A0A1I5S943_9BACI|nr:hypothetical protein [Salibacterium halotolerans]SFP67232.1 hypothetical protein SAMN05518683_10896 [Salibacterium halotolerans]